MTTARTIVLKGDPLQEERKASVAITPGMLCEIDSSGNVKPHATAGGDAYGLIAIENSLEGEEISDGYAIGDMVQLVTLRPGDEFYALVADTNNIAIGDKLCSNGDGYFKEYTQAEVASSGWTGYIYPQAIQAVALEARNMTSSILGAGYVRCKAV